MKLPNHLRTAAAAASALVMLSVVGVAVSPAHAVGGFAVIPADSGVGPAVPAAVEISSVVNFRDALGTAGTAASAPAGESQVGTTSLLVKDGVLWRSGKLAKASSAERETLAALLAGGTVIDLRTTKVARRSPDPRLAGVTRVAIPLTPGAYSRFVSSSTRRAAIAKAIRTVARAQGPVLIHCTYGRDRTGWTVAMIYSALGFGEDVVRAEYLKSSGATDAKLDSGLNRARAQYGSVQGYLEKGLKLSPDTIAALKAKLLG